MPQSRVFYVGTAAEVAHHTQPLLGRIDVQIIDPGEAVRIAKPGDIAIFYSEHFDRFRECSSSLQSNSVATIYAIDGILEWRNAWANRADEPACPWTMRPALAHKVACIGLHQARILRDWGNADRVEVVGLPRLDRLVAYAKHLEKSHAKSDSPFRLLVMTAKWPGFTPEQVARTLDSLRDLRDWLNNHPTIGGQPIEVIWRLTRGLEKELDVSNTLSESNGNELAELLTRVDAVVTTPSTAMLEAMLYGLPTATLDYHNVPSYVQPAWTIGNAGTIGPVLAELRNPSANRMHFQQLVLRDELECPGSATDRMAILVQKMQSIAAECLRDGRPLSFPSRLIPFEPSDETYLPAAELFPQHAAFRETDPLRLQAELAHARREIALLQAEIEQLRDELGQAHTIFDQINSHPIAGPVVRLRQKLIDKFGQLSQQKAKLESLDKSQ